MNRRKDNLSFKSKAIFISNKKSFGREREREREINSSNMKRVLYSKYKKVQNKKDYSF